MGLFICMDCGCVENTNCMDKITGEKNVDYPNMCRMEMDGFTEEYEDTKVRGPITYLCSKCNTGTAHTEFALIKAIPDEIELASYSPTNAITPNDHPEGCITGSFNEGYKVDERYKLFVQIFGKDVNKDNNLLFKIYLEDRMNFDIHCLISMMDNYYSKCNIEKYLYKDNEFIGYTKETSTAVEVYDGADKLKLTLHKSITTDVLYSIKVFLELPISSDVVLVNELKNPEDYICKDKTSLTMAIRASQIYKTESKSKTFRRFIATGSTIGPHLINAESFVYDYLKELKGKKKKHWKELQSSTEKELILRRAELKREIKTLKKQYPRLIPGDKLMRLEALEKESKEIKVKINTKDY